MSLEDIIDFSMFLQTLLSTVKEGGGNIWELDEFLMMFGKHWVKAVPTSRSRVAPAVSKEYDWTSFSSKMFGIADQLCSNADLLFSLLLQFNESNMISGKDTFTNR
ncbi:hypothetical protein [Brevibacillus sp. 179-C9.3 HS]|uniref:hypothetical protein n=1 Tax=unclassified Brevibacillus TaxID=2684853 RepID=UPI0039A27F25